MRKTLAALLTAAAVLGACLSASATPGRVNGSFTQQFQRPRQAHRLYIAVTAGRGTKTCDVTLAGKTVEVSLGTDRESQVTYIFYVYPRMAKLGLRQAMNASSPTGRIVCSH